MHRWNTGAAAVLAAWGVLAGAGAARADGMAFHATGAQGVAVHAQRAVLWQKADALELTIEPAFDWLGDGAAWIVPLPAVPEVAAGDAGLLRDLARLTDPVFASLCYEESCCCDGWACDAATGGPGVKGGEGVTVWASGTVGPIDWVVVGAGTGQDLYAWLDDHGFAVPSASRTVLDALLAEQSLFFAGRLGAPVKVGTSIAPVRFRFPPAVAPFYPLRLTASGLDAGGRLDVVLWLVSAVGGDVLGIPGAPLASAAADCTYGCGAEAYREGLDATFGAGAEGGWVLEYGGRLGEHPLVPAWGYMPDGANDHCQMAWGAQLDAETLGLGWTGAFASSSPETDRLLAPDTWYLTRYRGSLTAAGMQADLHPAPVAATAAIESNLYCHEVGSCGGGCPPCPDPDPVEPVPDPAGDAPVPDPIAGTEPGTAADASPDAGSEAAAEVASGPDAGEPEGGSGGCRAGGIAGPALPLALLPVLLIPLRRRPGPAPAPRRP